MSELPGLERPRPPRETERSMLDRIRVRYQRTVRNGNREGRRYIIAEHVPLDPGAWTGTRIADAIVADAYSAPWNDLTEHEQLQEKQGKRSTWGKRQSLHGFEVKVSRADWLTELADPTKAEAWGRYCHYFWLVAADKSIVRDDLPDGWGLLLPHGKTLRAVARPTRRDVEPMPVPTVVALLRAVQRTETDIATGITNTAALAAERTA